MKERIKKLFLLALATGWVVTLFDRAEAQTFRTLHSFTAGAGNPATNSDGAYPISGLVITNDTLYGAAYYGGNSAVGTLFRIKTDGSNFTNLHSFVRNSDGAYPDAQLMLSGSTVYGAASGGGGSGAGTIFELNVDDGGFTNLYSLFNGFNSSNQYGTNGSSPIGLALSGTNLYGAASFGGASGNGTEFSLDIDGTGFTNIYDFSFQQFANGISSNNDGANPMSTLVLSGNILYGTANLGGNFGNGTVFAINTDGSGFTNLHNFTAFSGAFGTNTDGAQPFGNLVLSGDKLYGTTSSGGPSGYGTIFAMNTDGTDFTNIYCFTAASLSPPYANIDGAEPLAGLILSGQTLCGTTYSGGNSGKGTVFAINTDGTGFTNLHNFTGGSDGGNPRASLVQAGNALYGVAAFGGASTNGTVFSLSFAPQLSMTSSGTNIVLSWPASMVGFDYTAFALQSSPDLSSPTNWSPVPAVPIDVNGQYTVTNPISGGQQFYRLSR